MPHHRIRGSFTVLALGVLALAAACGSSTQSSSSSAGGGGGNANALCFGVQGKTYNIAMVRWAPSDIFFNGVQLGEQIEKDRIQKDCGVTMNWKLFGANDVTQQMNALQADLAAGADAIDLVPWKGAAFTNILKTQNEAGMPVVVHNANVPGAPQTFVAFDNVEAATIAGQAAVKKLDTMRGAGWRQGSGVFIELRCIITASFDIGRDKGYHSVIDPIMAANSNIKVETREVTCDDSKARQATDDIIAHYGTDKVLAVLAIDGDSGFGAQSSLDAHGIKYAQTDPKYIPVVAVDGSEAEMISMAKGEMLTAGEQPAVAEGIIVERLLFQQLAQGKLITAPSADSVYEMTDYAGAPWQPVKITTSPDFTGAWYQTKAFDTASLALDDHWHWANILDQSKTGTWPSYGSTGCTGCPAAG